MSTLPHIESSQQAFVEQYGIYAKNAGQLDKMMQEQAVEPQSHQTIRQVVANPLHPAHQTAVAKALGESGYIFLMTSGRVVAHNQDIRVQGKEPYNEFSEFLTRAVAGDSTLGKISGDPLKRDLLFRVCVYPALPICIQAARGVPYARLTTVSDIDGAVELLDQSGYGVIDDGDGPAYAGDVYHLRNWGNMCVYLRDNVDQVLRDLGLTMPEAEKKKLSKIEYTEAMYPLTRAIGGWESCCAIFGANDFEKYTDDSGKDHVRIEGLSEAESDKLLTHLADYKNDRVQVDFSNMRPGELKAGFVENTRKFKQQGIVSSLGTSSRSGGIIWRAVDLGTLLDAKADGRLLREHGLAGKPEAPLFLLACLRLGKHPRRCVVVEDAPKGIAAGNRGAFATIGIEIEGSFEQEKEVRFVDGSKVEVPKDYIRALPIVTTVRAYLDKQADYDAEQKATHTGFTITDDVPDVLVSDFADITPEMVRKVVEHHQEKFAAKGGEKPLRDLMAKLLGSWLPA
jgi:beta-phosphoglucomutase-like phosphatase (HAD superfamily)